MPSDRPSVSGGCLCGAVRYEADEPPFSVGYCHCRLCQKGVGNAFGTAALFRRDGLRFLTGELTWFQSSPTVRRGFCGRCGSPIAAQHEDRSYTAIWLGTLDDPAPYEPSVQWYCDSRVPWVSVGQGLPEETEVLATFSTAGNAP